VIVAAFMDSYNGIVRAVRNYKAQTVKGGLGTGGQMAVQGAGDTGMSVQDAQARLNELGFNVGKPDGNLGPKSKAQLKKFQQSRRISATGILDEATVNELSK